MTSLADGTQADDTQVGTAPTFEVHSPADGRVLDRLQIDDVDHVAAKAGRLRDAQTSWEEMGPRTRSGYLLTWLDWMMDNERHLLELVQSESGKSWGDASLEVAAAVDVINYAARNAPRWLADRHVRPHSIAYATKRLTIHARPYPLVGVILPWNMPLGMPLLDIPFALAAGSAVLSKPSEVAPLSWTEAVRGWREEIGAPPVLDVTTGLGATGAAVVDVVDMVQFTGSTKTGRAVAMRAAERLIPCSVELGGKDPMIVLEDADVDRAVKGAVWGSMFNAGQACISVERLYVHDRIHDDFVGKLVVEVDALRQGTDADQSYSRDIGALANRAQVDIVERHVNDAIAKGARVATGGTRSEIGNYFAPTVLVNVDHSMTVMREETFGPVLPVMRVHDDDEAIRLANDSNYGLSGSVWTKDSRRAQRFAKRMESGQVCANNALIGVFMLPLPFGGWKESGLGVRNSGSYAVHKYCRHQGFVSERFQFKREMIWYPYRAGRSKLVGRMIRVLGMHDWRRRLGLTPAGSAPERYRRDASTTGLDAK